MITVVMGEVCSGKSTWVRSQAKENDVVIDLDRIGLALSCEGVKHHEYQNQVRRCAIAARLSAINEALKIHKNNSSFNVFIIHADPSSRQLAQYNCHGAKFKTMTENHDVLLSRANTQRPKKQAEKLKKKLLQSQAFQGVGSRNFQTERHHPTAPVSEFLPGFQKKE